MGAANALGSARRLLRYVPGALYEIGVACVIALTFAPQLVTDAARVRAAHRLRGQNGTGLRSLRRLAMPVLEGALERSVDLAAAMDSRGYGRTTDESAASRRLTGLLVFGGLLGVCIGIYGLLDGTASAWLGMPMLLVGLVVAGAGLHVGRPAQRTDPLPARPVGTARVAGVGVRRGGRGGGLRRRAPAPGGVLPGQRHRPAAGAAADRGRHPGRRAAGLPGPAAAAGRVAERPRAVGHRRPADRMEVAA